MTGLVGEGGPGLDRDDLAADPVTQWHRWYTDAQEGGVYQPEAAALATVDERGRPDVRYVLARGVDERGVRFFTDERSAKAAHLAGTPYAAMAFGWLELHRQVRLRGRVERVPADEADAYFASRPRGSQLGAWASHQSAVIPEREVLDRQVAEVEARFAGQAVPRPPYWGGYRLVPEVAEFWQGRTHRLHDRFRYRRDGDAWIIERLSP